MYVDVVLVMAYIWFVDLDRGMSAVLVVIELWNFYILP